MDPTTVPIIAAQWALVAANVTTGVIGLQYFDPNLNNVNGVFRPTVLFTQRAHGNPPPTDTEDSRAMTGDQLIIDSSNPIDVYMYSPIHPLTAVVTAS